jgi:transcriptional regulator with XRE-family HTH domain
MMEAGDPNVQRRRLARDLRGGREAAALTQREAADRLEWSLSKLIRIESGAQGISVTDLKATLELYGLTDPDQVAMLVEAARGSRGQPWWTAYRDIVSPQFAKYLGYEGQAASFRIFHPFLIPGLLHTEEYAGALPGDYGEPDRDRRIVDLRAERQERVFTRPGAELAFLVAEEALYRWIGGAHVMRRQLERLLEVDERPGVSVRIVPFKAGSYPGLRGPMVLVGLEESHEQVLFLEGVSGDQLLRDDPEKISEYSEYFEKMAKLVLPAEKGNALLRGQIELLRQAGQGDADQAAG